MTKQVLFWNCCGGISGKIDSVKWFLNTYHPEIMFISEAEYTQHQTWVKFENYQLEVPATLAYGKARIVALIHENSNFTRSNIIVDDTLEIVILENNSKIIAGVYRPFKNVADNTQTIYFDKLLATLARVSRSTKKVCIGGDFNINYEKESQLKSLLDLWSLENDLTQLIEEPTWHRTVKIDNINHLRKSCLDLIFTNGEGNHEVLDRLTSDHNCTAFTFTGHNLKISRKKFKRRDYRAYKNEAINNIFNDNLSNQSLSGDPEFDTDTVINATIDALDALCPKRTIRTALPTDIVDTALEKIKKKRKRLLKEYHRTGNHHTLDQINNLNKKIKSKIKEARQHQITLKLNGKNPKSFWNAVSELEGKQIRDQISLEINGKNTNDEQTLVEEFADFFLGKVERLSKSEGKLDYKIGHENLAITSDEVLKAAKRLKSKLCSGEDNIPMKIMKDIVIQNKDLFRDLFNNISSKGMPMRWKKAIITPLHKSGNKRLVTQYRPISNLDSLSKIYERIILNRLDALGEIDGNFQHGFKSNRSTTTAMIELQDFISMNLDKKKIVCTYSVDLSAAFDLLRPDLFYTNLKNIIPLSLMKTLLDFLSEREFCVELNETRSLTRKLKVGCVQGSILGPRLFTLYVRGLATLFNDAHLVTFADDSYVSIASDTMDEAKSNLISHLEAHNKFLNDIGMVTNVSKTELVFFQRPKHSLPCPDSITVNGEVIVPKTSIKVLGIQFDNDLSWSTHYSNVMKKSRHILAKMKFLSKYLDQNSMKKVITSHFFGALYYASPVWLSEITTSKQWHILNVLHYKGIRTVCRDFRRTKSRAQLDLILNRAKPKQWMRYSVCKLAIKLLHLGQSGPPMSDGLANNLYINERTGKASIMDTSRTKIGKASLKNRLESFKEISFNWKDGISDDALRIALKRTFFHN